MLSFGQCGDVIDVELYNVRVNDSGNNISLFTVKLMFYLT